MITELAINEHGWFVCPDYPDLWFSSEEWFKKTYDFAERTNQWQDLEQRYQYLQTMCENCNERMFLSPDFVLNSWYFQVYDRSHTKIPNDWQTQRHYNGGLIYHGPLEDGSHPETFAVTLTPGSSAWGIHT